ncbi:response regulator [Falsiruegeria mediterranea]|nr:response regulator [Falsiruegeria mediterranea]
MFLGMVVILLLAISVFSQNSYKVALQRELDKVEQSHVVIAENLASTLDRYAIDVKATFDFVVANYDQHYAQGSIDELLGSYDFRSVAVISPDNHVMNVLYDREFEAPREAALASLRANAATDKSTFSGVQRSPSGPVIYITRLFASGTLLVGVIDTSFLISQQLDIAFGDRGHAMIVDHEGRVLAHPKKEWVETSKDVAGLEVVQRMTSGQTGVMQFYAPPLKADVIAGYTSVPSTGWGAMVPQPISELEEAASAEANKLLGTLLVLFLIAALASWVLSGLIARPIHKLSEVVKKVRCGDLTARVPDFNFLTPTELVSLRFVFNGLLDNWAENRALLERSLEAAKEANMHKSNAISVLSHEMRTPLNGVVGAVGLLERTELTNSQKKYLGFVSTSTHTLLKHVNDVLEVSRLESCNVKLQKDCVNLSDMMKAIVEENSAQAERAGSQITLMFEPGMPLDVETDPRLLRTIAANLVGNAVKFAAGAKIDILLEFDPEGILEFVVKDNGPGIRSCDIESVFEPFTVLDASYGRHSEGTGLGLSIVATSVNALDGQIDLKSEEGAGSEFCVRIPVGLAPGSARFDNRDCNKARSLNGNRVSTGTAEHKKVLVVDDNEINRLLLTDMLEALGHSVSEAEDGRDAIDVAMNEHFDLILMDISMPHIDGTEAARLLRDRQGPNQHTKIIAQTAHASPKDRDEIFAAGMQGILTKPISTEALRLALTGKMTKECAVGFDNKSSRSVLELEPLNVLVSATGLELTGKSLDELFDEASCIIQLFKTCDPSYFEEECVRSRVRNTTGVCATLGAKNLHTSFYKIEDSLKRGSMVSSRKRLLDAAERALEETRNASSNLIYQLKQA